MKRILVISYLLACTFLSPACVLAAVEKGEGDLLDRLQGLSSRIETLASDFTQEKYLAVFQDVILSRGRFYFKAPDGLRWELTRPVATGFVLVGDEGRRWHERTGRSESFDLNREPVMKIVAQQLLAWARADFDRLRKEYRIIVIAEEPVRLRLEPLFDSAGFLDHLRIAFAPGGRHVESVEVHEKDGDFTRIIFENTRINEALAEDLF